MKKFLKNKKVSTKFYEEVEPQEIFLDSLAKRKEEKWGISEKKSEVPLSQKSLLGVFVLFLIFTFCFLIKTFQFQILEYKKFLTAAQNNKFIFNSLKAARGVIYDIKGNQLVFNKPSFDLVISKSNLPKDEEKKKNVLKEISEVIKTNLDDLNKKISENENDKIILVENLDQKTLIILETKILDLPGAKIEENFIRDYKDGAIFSDVVGYMGRISSEEYKKNPEYYTIFDYVGKVGVEKTYEEFLRRNPGKIKIERNAKGDIISNEVMSSPEPGKNLVLWIDYDLQKKLQEEIQKELDKIGAKNAAAVAINPQTGGVMALVSLPSFDNNLFNSGSDAEKIAEILNDPQNPLFNRAISGLYPTGSTIKPFIASAALEEKVISPTKTINCTGQITIPHRYEPEIVDTYTDLRIHGIIDMRTAIAESCNVYFYTIGGGYGTQTGLGPSRIKKYLEFFGWGSKIGVDIPGESETFIPSPEWKKEKQKENWWDGDTYNISIGQGDILITPLEVASAFAAIANGGTLYRPKIAKQIIDDNKNIIQEFQSEIIRKDFISPDNLQIVREGMRWAVTGQNSPTASSVLLNSLPVAAAAKTGTAQTPKENYFHNWVTVFAPYDNPQIVLTIMIENVQGIQAVALPIANEVLNWYFSKSK